MTRQRLWKVSVLASICVLAGLHACPNALFARETKTFRAGAAAVDISPVTFPAVVSGSFTERTASGINDPLYARALVLDDGTTKLAIVVVDTLFMPREMIDEVKQAASASTGIPA